MIEVGEFFLEGKGGGRFCDFGDRGRGFFGEEILDDAKEADNAEEDEHFADLASKSLAK